MRPTILTIVTILVVADVFLFDLTMTERIAHLLLVSADVLQAQVTENCRHLKALVWE